MDDSCRHVGVECLKTFNATFALAIAVKNRFADFATDWVRRYAIHLPKNQAPVLDLACGGGRHAYFLRQQGYAVLALDKDTSAFAQLQQAGVCTLDYDLEQVGRALPFEDASFSGILVCNYLHRPLLPELLRCLQVGGVLIYDTFMQGHQKYGRPHRDEFLLNTDELLDFARLAQLEVLAFEQGLQSSALDGPSMRQSLCAIKR